MENKLRTFYWAAYHGLTEYLRLMLIYYRWSPFIKSFEGKSILVAAITGDQIDTAKMILDYWYLATDYEYGGKEKSLAGKLKVFGKDKDDNNIL